jgi:DNA-binding transcriptional ArsR family regulator
MANKKLQKSIDTVKGDVRELVEAFWALRDEVMTQQAVLAAEHQSRGGSSGEADASSSLPEKLAGTTTGHVRSFGYYEMPDHTGQQRVYRWALEDHPVEEVLSLPVDDAAKLLSAIGHKQRLAIVMMLLRKPATAVEMVTTLSLGTTGAAYHHLNVLQGSGLVEQAQRGIFSIVPGQVPSLLTILGGLSDAIEASVEHVQPARDEEPEPAEE